MDAYERKVIRRIYEAACMGDRRALRILESLTTKRRKNGKCRYCGGPLRKKILKFCCQHCANRQPGRRKKVSTGPKRKLSSEQIEMIKREYVPKDRIKRLELAKRFGVNEKTIYVVATDYKYPTKKSTALKLQPSPSFRANQE